MGRFPLVWLAQVVSATGSQMTGFALGIWLYARTGQATWYGIVALATLAPAVLAAPLAGVFVDRWDRRRALVAGQVGAGLCSLLTLAALALAAPPVVLLGPVLLGAVCRSIELPALAALTASLVPAKALGRANGMLQLGAACAQIVAPATAAALLPPIGVRGVVAIDLATFAAATALLLSVSSPRTAVAPAAGRTLRADLAEAWQFLAARPGLRALLLLAAAINLSLGMLQVLAAPIVLGIAPAKTLGAISSAAGAGMLAGALVGTAWGGPRRRVRGVLLCCAVQGFMFLLGAARPSPWLIGAGAVAAMITLPLMVQAASTIWHHKVPRPLQGRVFALRALCTGAALSVGYLAAGPLADRGFEPLLRGDGLLVDSVGRLLGVGAGRGAALLLELVGLSTLVATALAAASPRLRRLEEELPNAGLED